MGAWIETTPAFNAFICFFVAPFVGAWIETTGFSENPQEETSLPSWERGLKLTSPGFLPGQHRSLPSWERGLKPVPCSTSSLRPPSLPSWERGLKLPLHYNHLYFESVAPFVGAWIETMKVIMTKQKKNTSLPSWERGLKHRRLQSRLRRAWSLPSWERGLKRLVVHCLRRSFVVAPFVGAWIETS